MLQCFGLELYSEQNAFLEAQHFSGPNQTVYVIFFYSPPPPPRCAPGAHWPAPGAGAELYHWKACPVMSSMDIRPAAEAAASAASSLHAPVCMHAPGLSACALNYLHAPGHCLYAPFCGSLPACLFPDSARVAPSHAPTALPGQLLPVPPCSAAPILAHSPAKQLPPPRAALLLPHPQVPHHPRRHPHHQGQLRVQTAKPMMCMLWCASNCVGCRAGQQAHQRLL
jgi:hypothetical protein